MEDQEKWLNRFANLWLAYEKERDIVHSEESIDEHLGKLLKEELNPGITSEKTKEQEEWLKRFANVWLTCGKNPDAFEKLKKPEPSKDTIKNELIELKMGLESLHEHSVSKEKRKRHCEDVLAEQIKGKIIIADTLLGPVEGKGKRDLSTLKEEEVNPNDTIIFDIDPEMAIKMLTASKGHSL